MGEKQGSLILNRATQSYLSPGSTIKPVSVYAPALELGLVTPATVMDDTPYSFTDARHWPKNSDSVYRGLMNINEAVKHSINTIPVKLVAQMTPEYCFEFAKEKMGLSSLVSSYVNAAGDTFSDIDLAPLAMGGLTKGVSVKAMAQAYASFANEGVWREARTYTKVVDADGKVVLDNTQQSHVAMKDMTAWYITYMLENTVESGSGTAAQIENMTVAGKTGTTTSDFDRWFAGYTPYYTGVVWCGYDDPEEVVLTDSSANPATVLWQKVMAKVHEGLANKEFNKPTNVVECTVCQDSGLLMTDACREDPRGSRAITVELSLYDVPTQNCNVHKEVEICGASGHVVNEYCKQVEGNTTKTVGLLDVSRAFPVRGITVQDQAYAVPNDSLPAGYYPALSPDVDAINVECYIHTRDDLPEPEAPEEDEGGNQRQPHFLCRARYLKRRQSERLKKQENDMWLSDEWKDYEVIDTSSGEKLERWGKYILVRPDPQVIWTTPKQHPLWRKYDAKYSRSNTGGGKWSNLRLPEQWQVHYKELTFNVKPMNFKHTGVFPEQAANWDFAMEKIRTAGRPISVLNLFAYTGGATIACAAAGASVCHVDAAKGMVAWAKENARSSGLEDKPIRWIVDDCGKFVERESAGAGATTRSSWTRRAMEEVRPARCGSSKRTCIRLWSWQVRFSATTRCL